MKNSLMKDALSVVKKEFARFFGDRRMVVTTVLLPGIMIYVMYTFMGSFMQEEFTHDEEYIPKAYVENMPAELSDDFKQLSEEWKTYEAGQSADDVKQMIQDKEADVLVVFPETFIQDVRGYDVTTGAVAPNVEVYYNSSETESLTLYSGVEYLLNNYESAMANKFDVNAGELQYDCATEKDVAGQILSMMMPMLLMIFLYSGCIAVAPESIAGEKERGTIATMLVTPMRRSSLALGKLIALSVIALLSGLSSFVGTYLSLPKIMGGDEMGINTNVYALSDFGMLLGVILSTVLVLVAVISILSAYAKSVKEAGTLVSPLMIVVMLISISPMFLGDLEKTLPLFMIPVFNSALSIQGIFSFTYTPVQIVVTMVVNLVTAGILTFVLKKMFDSEKIMFAK